MKYKERRLFETAFFFNDLDTCSSIEFNLISYSILVYTTIDITYPKTKNDKLCQTPKVFWVNTVLNYIVPEAGQSNDSIKGALAPWVSGLPYSILF